MNDARDPGAAYRAASGELPPPALDAAILGAARAAAAARHSKPSWTRRWGRPLALAASVVLGLGIVLRVAVERPGLEPMIEPSVREASAPTAPAGAPASAPADAPADLRLRRSDAPATPAARNAQAPEAARAAEPMQEQRRMTERARPFPDAAPETVGRVARADAPSAAEARASAEAAGVDAVARKEAVPAAPAASALPPVARGPGVASTTEPEPGPAAKTLADAPAPARAEAAPARGAPPSSPAPVPQERAAPRMAAPAPAVIAVPEVRARKSEEASRRDATGATGAGAPGVAAAAGENVEVIEAGLTPEAWLRRIVELRRAGRDAEADASLTRFVRRHPQVQVPPEARPAVRQ